MAWIRLFYNDIAVFQSNGWTSDFFSSSHRVRHGCPLSPYLLILCAKVLGNSVRNDTMIQEIKVLDTECKITQYADDTTFILDGSQSSLSRSLYLLNTFALIYRVLKSNMKKLKVYGLAPENVQKSPSPPQNQYYGPKIKYMHWEYDFQILEILLHITAFWKRQINSKVFLIVGWREN